MQDYVVVKELAELLGLRPFKVVADVMELGLFKHADEVIDGRHDRDEARVCRRTDSAVMGLDQLPLAVQHPHLVLVVAASSDGRGRNCLLNTGNVGK